MANLCHTHTGTTGCAYTAVTAPGEKKSNAQIFEAVITRNAAQGTLIDSLLDLFGGRAQPVMAHLIESGKLTIEDLRKAQKLIRRLSKNG
ncbi:MAG: hypothetical protein JXA73_12020 [Acidobacteria bacterium]|nr:hypothetical protein [Acidobacteriota bacterium]